MIKGTLYLMIWILASYIVYILSSGSKLKIMSCRKKLRRFKKLDESDKNSLF